MANNYKETIAEGQVTKWIRCKGITIYNPYNDIPSIEFSEEVKVVLPDGTIITNPCTEVPVRELMSDPTKVINLQNPSTGETIGTATYQQIYVMLFSLYRQLVAARDMVIPE